MNDNYDPDRNAAGCYNVAIRAIRLQGVRDGRFVPRANDPEELAAAVGEPRQAPDAAFTNAVAQILAELEVRLIYGTPGAGPLELVAGLVTLLALERAAASGATEREKLPASAAPAESGRCVDEN